MNPEMIAKLRGAPGLLLVLLLTAIAYAPSLDNLFVYDDNRIVRAVSDTGQVNPMVAELQALGDYFTTEYWLGTGADAIHSNPLYRPVTVLSFAVTHALLPGDGSLASEAWPHHLANLLVHLANTLLVFFVLRSWMGTSSFGPIVGAALFGLAAIHTEAVVAIVGRADLFACGFGLGAWLCLGRSFGHNVAASLLLFLSFCSKESALAWWPFLCCAAAARSWSADGSAWRALAAPLAIGAVPAVLWFVLRSNAFVDLPAAYPVAHVSNPLRDMNAASRIVAAMLVQGFATLKMVVPYPLSCDYGASVFGFAKPGGERTILDWLFFLPLLASVATAGYGLGRRHAGCFLGGAALLGFAFVTSNVPFVVGTIWGERLAYLPSLGIAILGGALCNRPSLARGATVALAIYLAANAAIALRRADDWQDDATLFVTDAETHPESLALAMQAAIVLRNRGDLDGWRRKIEHAVKVEPEWARGYIELGAGAFHEAQRTKQAQKLDESSRWLNRALEAGIIEPTEKTMAWRNFAILMLQRGDKATAMRYFEKIVEADPKSVSSRHQVLDDVGRSYPESELERFLAGGEKARPGHPMWELHRGLRAARRKDFVAAQRHLEAALPRITLLDRIVQNAWIVLAQLRAKAGDVKGSKELFGRIAGDARFAPDMRQAAERSR